MTVLYEGRQIYFGLIAEAREYFINLGFECDQHQTTPDFLTSVTNPEERVVRFGFEGTIPRTPDEFAAAWRASIQRTDLLRSIAEFNTQYPILGPSFDRFKSSRRVSQSESLCAAPSHPTWSLLTCIDEKRHLTLFPYRCKFDFA